MDRKENSPVLTERIDYKKYREEKDPKFNGQTQLTLIKDYYRRKLCIFDEHLRKNESYLL